MAGITRKDFINGIAFGAGAAALTPTLAWGQQAGPDGSIKPPLARMGISQSDPRYYPPTLTGMRGSHPGSFAAAHAKRDGEAWVESKPRDLNQHYDLVVVGGGISGLSAAYFYRQLNPAARVLVLDNHDDFGGHAKRNEFHVPGKGMVLGFGGTQSLEGVSTFSPTALKLLSDIGVEPKRFYRYFDQEYYKRQGLDAGIFFDRETFGRDVLLKGDGVDAPLGGAGDGAALRRSLEGAPITDQAKADIVRLQTEVRDYLPAVSSQQKAAALGRMSYAQFLIDHVKVHPDVLKYYNSRLHGLRAVGIEAIDAHFGNMTLSPAALKGMGLELPDLLGGEPYIFHFPDGNASVARLLVRAMIPQSAPGATMEDIVTAKLNYAALDRDAQPVRIRLNSTVVRAVNEGEGVAITYELDGKAYRVKARHAVLACWHSIIPYIAPELPEPQKQALSACVKVPLVYGTVLLSNWKALKALGLKSAYCPGAYFSEVTMDFPVSLGDYRFTDQADEPCVLHLVRTPTPAPGGSYRDQYRAARAELYSTPFETFERETRLQLERMLKPGGFKQSDILAITINRWPHGYTYMPSPLWDEELPEDRQIHVVARKTFGRLAIANADAGGFAATQLAIDQAHRAVTELLA